jgi:hypothetical protein
MKKPGYAKLFDGLNYAGAALTFLAALGVIASTTRLSAEYPNILPLVFIAYAAGQLLIVIANVGLTRIRFNLKTVIALTGLYTLLSFWDFISILIVLPFIVISMVLGPFMIIVFVLAAVVLGMYLVEEVIGYDFRGYISILENPLQALIALVALAISFLVLRWHLGKDESEDWVMEKAGDLSFNIRQQLQRMVGEIVQKNSHD